MATIQEFLVSIGYETRQSEIDLWVGTLKKFEGWVFQLGDAIGRFERRASALLVETTADLDQLNFAAQRTGTSVDSLKALTYSLRQIGLGGDRAQGLVESFAAQMRKLPSLAAIQQQFGVRTTDRGAPRDSAALLKDTVRGLDRLEYPVAVKYAELFGIPEEDYNVLRGNADKIDQLEREQREVFSRFGLDGAGESSTLLSIGWRHAQMTLDGLFSKIAFSIGPSVTPLIAGLTEWMEGNQDRIVTVSRRVVQAFDDLASWLSRLLQRLFGAGGGLLDFIEWAAGSNGFLRAVEIVSGAFLVGIVAQMVTPLGLVVAGITALASMLPVGPAKAATPSAKAGKQRGGVFARARAAVTRNRTHGASGSWGEGGASGSWDGGGGRSHSRASGGAGGSGGRWEGPAPAPSSDASPALADARAQFRKELEDPEVAARFADYVEAEVGGQGAEAQQAFIESIFNRAAARGQTLRQTLDGPYFPGVTHRKASRYQGDPRVRERYKAMIDSALGGSNISGYATGNASGSVGFGGGPETSRHGGEKYGVERSDIPWVRERMEEDRRRQLPPSPPPKPPELHAPQIDAPPLGTTIDDLSVSLDQDTEIIVHGDPDPTRTTSEVAAAQVRVNKGVANQLEKAVA